MILIKDITKNSQILLQGVRLFDTNVKEFSVKVYTNSKYEKDIDVVDLVEVSSGTTVVLTPTILQSLEEGRVCFNIDIEYEDSISNNRIIQTQYYLRKNNTISPTPTPPTEESGNTSGNCQCDLTSINRRLTALENRPSEAYDDTNVKKDIQNNAKSIGTIEDTLQAFDALHDTLNGRIEVLENKPSGSGNCECDLTEINQRLDSLENKPSEVYDDSEVKRRLEVLENKEDKDTVFDDSEINRRLTALENKEPIECECDLTTINQRLDALENREPSAEGDLNSINEKIDDILNARTVSIIGSDYKTIELYHIGVVNGERYASKYNKIKSVVIGEGIKEIDRYSTFEDCTQLSSVQFLGNTNVEKVSGIFEDTKITELTVPSINETLPVSMCCNCTELVKVTIPKVTSMGIYIFMGCTKLKEIHFNGTTSDWNRLMNTLEYQNSEGSYFYNVPRDCKIICTDGDVLVDVDRFEP